MIKQEIFLFCRNLAMWGEGMGNELDSMCGITDEELTKRFIEAVRIENEIKRVKGVPIACFDESIGKPYLLYENGRRDYDF